MGGHSLVGRLSFRYSYDAKRGTVTVCGTDYPSADGMTLITMPQGTDKDCFEHAAFTGFLVDEIYRNGSWNYHSRLMPGAAKIFKDIARGANNAMIAALKAESKLPVQVREMLPELPIDQYLNLCAVLRDGKLLKMYDQTHDYEKNDTIIGIEWIIWRQDDIGERDPHRQCSWKRQRSKDWRPGVD